MLPTIDRWPRRSTYSSATFQSPLALDRDRRRPPPLPVPLLSTTATRVSPASTETSMRFFKCSPRREGLPACQQVRPALGGEPRLDVDALQEPDRHEGDDHGRSSEAHQRQGDAGHRHYPD